MLYRIKYTIKDLIEKIIESREFRLIENKRTYILDSINHINLYDLHLCL